MQRFLLSLVAGYAVLFVGCDAPEREFERLTLSSGRDLDVFFNGPFGNGNDEIWLFEYRNLWEGKSLEEMSEEIEEIWVDIRPRVEESGIKQANIWMVDTRRKIVWMHWQPTIRLERSTCASYELLESGEWQRTGLEECPCGGDAVPCEGGSRQSGRGSKVSPNVVLQLTNGAAGSR